MNKKHLETKLDGFTLTEMLAVLIIIGILVVIALPNLMPLIAKTKSTEAKISLGHIEKLQKTYFMEYNKYSEELNQIGFEAELPKTEGGKANYAFEVVEATNNAFIVKAVAVVDFDQDGQFNEWQINEKGDLVETVQD